MYGVHSPVPEWQLQHTESSIFREKEVCGEGEVCGKDNCRQILLGQDYSNSEEDYSAELKVL